MLEMHPNEKVIMYIRKHIFFLFMDVFMIVLIFIVPVAGIWFLQYINFIPDATLFGISLTNMTDILIYIWAILCWLFLAEKFTRYSLNFWVLTNKRIVESDLTKLFDRRLSVLELPDVEDITLEVKGFLGSSIDYGSLEVQTAGAKREFIATNISNPVAAQEAIFGAKINLKKEESDIERREYEQMSERILDEKINSGFFNIPHDQTTERIFQKINQKTADNFNKDFDWAHNIDPEKVDGDKYLEALEEKYKINTEKALRSE